ncbi:hypothetical protein PLICRDRAFT_48489 [Plicaturopsis crispa FD-325 SS-3]|nr:hypothetical protein PLICRDRAFT_48489 [Plicaturopsis crispa FD-325 SS-3]
MNSLISLSLLAISAVSSGVAKPLSTTPYNVPSVRAPWTLAPLMEADHPHGTINNSYIVMLKPDVAPSVMQNHFNFLQMAHESDPLVGDGSGLSQVYDGHLKGYAGKFTEGVLEQIRQMPEVDYIEKDQIVKTMEHDVQKGAPWGLARVSHRQRLRLGTFTVYEYENDGGEGVDAYVVDTGINIHHVEFEGRASWGKTIPQNDVDEDGNGHGTHCAGTIASRAYGVAKAANVIAVKVLGSNGSGSMSDVVGGVQWAATAAAKKAAAATAEYIATGKTKHKGSVANMSLGGGKSRALDDSVNAAVAGGLHFAVAAGNDNRDACNYSPAAAEQAVTVGASTLSDERAYFSNHGKCVDVFAPGLNIKSTWTGSPTAIQTISGTSMASPHTAGMLAYLLSIYPHATFNPEVAKLFASAPLPAQPAAPTGLYALVHSSLPSWVAEFLPPPQLLSVFLPSASGPPTLSPAQLKQALLTLSTKGALTDALPAGTPNLLIYNNATA